MSSGLAGEIRGSTCSEQFDLGGYTELRATELMRAAFGSPLESPSTMVRFTFVVGGNYYLSELSTYSSVTVEGHRKFVLLT